MTPLALTPLQLAQRYLECFCAADIEALAGLLAPELQFTGPFHEFSCAADYLQSLRDDPPRDVQYSLLHRSEDERGACLIYEYTKPGVSTTMAQWFEVKHNKISKIILVFDRGAFASS